MKRPSFVELLRFDTEEAWAEAVADRWREQLRSQPRSRMCLPSGHTPVPIYAALGRRIAAGEISLRETEVFALDEYGGLASDDPGRCANMIRHHLLDRADLPPERFHALDTNRPDIDRVCADYAAVIDARPFDLVLLGLGLNGHLGLNEPGSPPDATVRRVDLHGASIASSAKYLAHARLPRWGVTVGLRQLLAAREVWLLASGSAKAEIIHRTVKGPITPDVPSTLLRRHSRCFLLIDGAAGSQL